MNDLNVGCIVTLGGDGTNRVVAKGCGQTPILPISTGTNYVCPQMTEGTIAGIAAGRIATRKITSKLFRKSKKINVFVNDELVDIALVDVAITNQMFLGSRAVWDPEVIDSIFLTRSEPLCIGLAKNCNGKVPNNTEFTDEDIKILDNFKINLNEIREKISNRFKFRHYSLRWRKRS